MFVQSGVQIFDTVCLFYKVKITTERTLGRTEHHGKLHVLISAEIREHKLAGQTLLLA
jgi:hypothetical protein